MLMTTTSSTQSSWCVVIMRFLQVAFVPQQPLLAPEHTLHAQLQYPAPVTGLKARPAAASPATPFTSELASDTVQEQQTAFERMQWALQRVGLQDLMQRAGGLDRSAPWIGADRCLHYIFLTCTDDHPD